jgi:hypothetical protein
VCGCRDVGGEAQILHHVGGGARGAVVTGDEAVLAAANRFDPRSRPPAATTGRRDRAPSARRVLSPPEGDDGRGDDELIAGLRDLAGAERAEVDGRAAGGEDRAARAASASVPPSMIDSVPALAPSTPPETGQSTTAHDPRSAGGVVRRSRARRWAKRSTRSAGAGLRRRRAGRRRRRGSSRSGRSGSMTRTASLRGELARCATARAESTRSGRGARDQIARRPRARMRWCAIGVPMAPVPIIPRRTSSAAETMS